MAIEKARAQEAIVFVKQAISSVRRYFLENNAVPASFDDLDITLPGARVANQPRRINISKYYYALMSATGGVTAYRIGATSEEPKITAEGPGSTTNASQVRKRYILCAAGQNNTQAERICRALGAKEANPPINNCGWAVGDYCLVIGYQ